MDMTYGILLTAQQALMAAGKLETPFPVRVKIAKIRRVVDAVCQDFHDAKQHAIESRAQKDDTNKAMATRSEGKPAEYLLTPDDELAIQQELQAFLKKPVSVTCDVLTLKDFPEKVGGQPQSVSADVLAALGPFLDLETV